MKIAIISDLHGNIDALESVLSDIELENCSKIFCFASSWDYRNSIVSQIERAQRTALLP